MLGKTHLTISFLFIILPFDDLHIILPFDDFTMGVLQILKVAPTQLHPNSWATLQVFCILCDIFKIIPTPQSFSRPSSPVSWLSLSSRPRSICFAPFTTSYKIFKEKYFKIFVESNDRDYFYTTEGEQNFLSIGHKILPKLSSGRGRQC